MFCLVRDVTGTENIIANEEHFLTHCSLYDESRGKILTKHSWGKNRMIDLFKNYNFAILARYYQTAF